MTEDYELIRKRLADVEVRVQGLEMLLDAAMRVIAALRPVGSMLSSYGATDSQERAVYQLIDEMLSRLESGYPASFTDFEERVYDLFPRQRGNRRFVEMLVETLKVERPASKKLYEHFTRAMALLRPEAV